MQFVPLVCSYIQYSTPHVFVFLSNGGTLKQNIKKSIFLKNEWLSKPCPGQTTKTIYQKNVMHLLKTDFVNAIIVDGDSS